jgi:hypothetical protein
MYAHMTACIRNNGYAFTRWPGGGLQQQAFVLCARQDLQSWACTQNWQLRHMFSPRLPNTYVSGPLSRMSTLRQQQAAGGQHMMRQTSLQHVHNDGDGLLSL